MKTLRHLLAIIFWLLAFLLFAVATVALGLSAVSSLTTSHRYSGVVVSDPVGGGGVDVKLDDGRTVSALSVCAKVCPTMEGDRVTVDINKQGDATVEAASIPYSGLIETMLLLFVCAALGTYILLVPLKRNLFTKA